MLTHYAYEGISEKAIPAAHRRSPETPTHCPTCGMKLHAITPRPRHINGDLSWCAACMTYLIGSKPIDGDI